MADSDATELWTIAKVLLWTQGHFKDKGIENPRLDAELLLAHVLQKNRIYLYTHFDQPLLTAEREAYRTLVKRRAQREPLAYIVGTREFYGRPFAVTPAVLIPRPETEHLVEAALAFVTAQALPAPRILDVGTGSGVLAVTLLCEIPQATAVAIDLSAEALTIANQNAVALNVAERFCTKLGDIYAPLDAERFDIIISNPPYIARADLPSLMPEVGRFEPHQALFADDHGLAILHRLVQGAPKYFENTGFFGVEVGAEQGPTVSGWLQELPQFGHVEILRDLAGHGRVVQALFGGVADSTPMAH